MTRLARDGLAVVVPWRTIALVVVACGIASRYHPVQVSTATFG